MATAALTGRSRQIESARTGGRRSWRTCDERKRRGVSFFRAFVKVMSKFCLEAGSSTEQIDRSRDGGETADRRELFDVAR
jgi:hypothetical protein